MSKIEQIRIIASFGKTLVVATDSQENAILWASSKGTRNNIVRSSKRAARNVAEAVIDSGVKAVEIYVKGPGSGKEPAINAIKKSGLDVTAIKDCTPAPKNGCRPQNY